MLRVGPMLNPAGGHVVTRLSLGAGDLNLKKPTVPTTEYIIEYTVFLLFFFNQRKDFFCLCANQLFFCQTTSSL